MRMEKYLNKTLDTLLIIILAAMSLIVAANVFCRFVLNFSLYWGDELAQILLIWLTFLGAAVAVRENSHYALNFLITKLQNRSRQWLIVFRTVLSLLAILILLYFSARVTWEIRTWVMPATEISRGWVYGACPLGCSFMLYYAIKNLWRSQKTEDGRPK